MNRLYIIGNGFDRYFNLPTTPQDFVKQLGKIPFKPIDLYDSFETAKDAYMNYGVEWSDFEKEIAEISLQTIADDIVSGPDYLSDHEYDRENVILRVRSFADELAYAKQLALSKMIESAETYLVEKYGNTPYKFASFFDSANDSIVSFNYTSTIETLFDYSREVLHIHGYYKQNDELILGYDVPSTSFEIFKKRLNSEMENNRMSEIVSIKNDAHLSSEQKESQIEAISSFYDQCWNDPYIDKEYQELVLFYEANRKKYQYEKLETFLRQLGTIDEVDVMGHSLGEVDRLYFELIEEVLSPKRWRKTVRDMNKIDYNLFSSYSFNSKMSFETLDYMFENK